MNEEIRVCPETGRNLDGVDLVAHALMLYPEYLDPARSSPEARKRQAEILAGGIPLSEYNKRKGVEK
ncbi:MAG: hypothetical protein ROW48_18345 [Bellilinea sp.]|jgi:capsule polysaccharide export protein KpsC/LpsZ